jgi:serine/threonine protein kinase
MPRNSTYTDSEKKVADQYGNAYQLADELARGGQGVVFRTTDADLAIKQPLGSDGEPDKSSDLMSRFIRIRCLPIPEGIPISLPLAVLRDEPGYVMRLLNGMTPFQHFYLDGEAKEELENEKLPAWLAEIPDKAASRLLQHYAMTGSTRRRLFALYKCAAILARLHADGLVYGDVSPNNAFIGKDESHEVWLIDADNLRYERCRNGESVYSPHYGAPEIVQAVDSTRPYSDCWAFSVMAFEMLALVHPFIGKKVLDPDDDEGGWDSEPTEDGAPKDLDEQAYAGYLPFVDDEDDDSNEAMSGLPRQLVATPRINQLLQETFGAGRTQPWRRPSLAIWAFALAEAFDQSLVCPNCSMSYYHAQDACPYCGTAQPQHILAKTDGWALAIPDKTTVFCLPHRMFHPFSLRYGDDTEHEVAIDWSTKTVAAVRGTDRLPDDSISFEFVGGGR